MSDKRKVAVCGTAPSSLEDAPFDDPEWEIWGTSRLWKQIPRADAWFELHPLDEIGRGWNCSEKERKEQRAEHVEWMGNQDTPIYLQTEDERVPGGIEYPLDEVLDYMEEEHGDDTGYFTNSISYMLALALYMEVDEVGIWGVDMALDSEYQVQRPSVEYWLGMLRGAGIEVTVPASCDLLQTSHLYGYEWDEGSRFNRKMDARLSELENRKQNAKNQLNELAQLHAACGAIAENVGPILQEHDLPPDAERELAGLVKEAQDQAQQAQQQAERLKAKRERLIGAQDNVEYIKRSFAGQNGADPEEADLDMDDVIDMQEAAVGG